MHDDRNRHNQHSRRKHKKPVFLISMIVLAAIVAVLMLLLAKQQAAKDEAAAAASSAAAVKAEQAAAEAASKEAAEAASKEAAAEAASAKAAALPGSLETNEQALGEQDLTQSSFKGSGPQTQPDWTKLSAENPDLLGYMEVPGTDIQTVIQKSDDGKGAVYIDAGNNLDFTDPNTVLYGGNALQSLQDYGDSEFLTEHPYLYLSTPTETCEYRVFAAYTSEDERDASLLTSYNCYDDQVFSQYIAQVLSMRSLSADIDASQQQNILNAWRILTIEVVQDNERYLVQATLTGEQ
jgi:sortase B